MSTMETGTQVGPASYSAGGFTIATGLATVDFADVQIGVIGANLPPFHAEFSRSGANVTVKLMRHRYDKTGANVGAVSGLPAGVTAAAASGQSYDANTAHLHSIAHDHGATTSTAPTAGGVGVNTLLGSGNLSTHTHSFDVPNYTGDSGTTTHTHTNNNIYQHQHSLTNTETDEASSEIAAGTDLSGTTFYYMAVQL